jgi:transposase
LINTLTLRQIAEQYDVVETTVKRWIIEEGLRPLTREERWEAKRRIYQYPKERKGKWD